ncbi:MAG: hypothetical protein WCF84_00660 [Anaerolineae bacterium]
MSNPTYDPAQVAGQPVRKPYDKPSILYRSPLEALATNCTIDTNLKNTGLCTINTTLRS